MSLLERIRYKHINGVLSIIGLNTKMYKTSLGIKILIRCLVSAPQKINLKNSLNKCKIMSVPPEFLEKLLYRIIRLPFPM